MRWTSSSELLPLGLRPPGLRSPGLRPLELRRLGLVSCLLALLAPDLFAQLPVLRRGAKGEAVALLQVALSNREFSPGAIDGRFGAALRAALVDYQRSQGLVPDGIAGPAVWGDLGLAEVEAAAAPAEDPEAAGFRSYTVTPADTTGLAPLPAEWKARAALDLLPYETTLERLAERSQAAREYLASLNVGAGWPNPPPGTTVRIPAVAFETVVEVALPFRKAVAADADSAARETDSIAAALADSAIGELRSRWEQRAPESVRVEVSVRERVVRVYEGERFVARYPATVGSRQFPNPAGEWKIVSQVYAPDYRYDERYLETGRKSKESLRIPPGPNNIVGLVWLGLDKEGFGLHGTDEPETIGASASHGCVRLTNWDAERLARRVGIGTPVTISP